MAPYVIPFIPYAFILIPLPLGCSFLGNESGRFILFVSHMRVYPIVYLLKELFFLLCLLPFLWSSVCILPSMRYNPLSSRHVFLRLLTNFLFFLLWFCFRFVHILLLYLLVLVINFDPFFFFFLLYRPFLLQ